LKDASAHQGCIYLIKNTLKTDKFYINIDILNNLNILKIIYSLNFQHHYSSLQYHMMIKDHLKDHMILQKSI